MLELKSVQKKELRGTQTNDRKKLCCAKLIATVHWEAWMPRNPWGRRSCSSSVYPLQGI